MGRRHFQLGARGSLAESSCRVVYEDPRVWQPHGTKRIVVPLQAQVTLWEEPAPWAPSRRLFLQREVPCAADPADDQSSTPAKRYFYDVERQESAPAMWPAASAACPPPGRPEEPPPCGKRHLRPPSGHLSGNAPEVVRDDSPRAGRRQCGTGSRAQSACGSECGAPLPPQRRHIRRQDHLVGSALPVPGGPPTPAPKPTRRPCPFDPSIMRATLQHRPPADRSAPREPSRPRRPSSRSLRAPQDNLLGGGFRDGPTPASAPATPRAREPNR